MKNGSLLKDSKGKVSKGKIGGICVLVGGAIVVVGQFLQGDVNVEALIQALVTLGTGLGIFGLRDAQK